MNISFANCSKENRKANKYISMPTFTCCLATVRTMTSRWFYRPQARLWQTCSSRWKPSKRLRSCHEIINHYCYFGRLQPVISHKNLQTITDEVLNTTDRALRSYQGRCKYYQNSLQIIDQRKEGRPSRNAKEIYSLAYKFGSWKRISD